MSYPDQFKFKNALHRVFCMQKVNHEGEYVWLCTHEEDGYAVGHPWEFAYYTADEIGMRISRKDWKVVVDEPELVFPFTFYVTEWGESSTIYTATKHTKGGFIQIDWENDFDGLGTPYSAEKVKSYIKGGDWTVKSVGEPKAATEPSKAPTSDVLSLAVEVDTTQIKAATEALKELVMVAKEAEKALLRLKYVFD